MFCSRSFVTLLMTSKGALPSELLFLFFESVSDIRITLYVAENRGEMRRCVSTGLGHSSLEA